MSSHKKIEQHLIQQKRRAGVMGEDGEFRCKYRTPTGDMCAAGCLIPDDKYQETMEGSGATYVARSGEVFPKDISVAQLRDWQHYHDSVLYTEYGIFRYQAWVEGNEAHHPTLAADAIQRVADEKAEKAKAFEVEFNAKGKMTGIMQSNLCQEIIQPVS